MDFTLKLVQQPKRDQASCKVKKKFRMRPLFYSWLLAGYVIARWFGRHALGRSFLRRRDATRRATSTQRGEHIFYVDSMHST
jgi:hypothetical protein